MSSRFDHTEDAFKNIAPPFHSEMVSPVAIPRRDPSNNVFSPWIFVFVGSSLIHCDFCIFSAQAGTELSGGAKTPHVYCESSVFYKWRQADIHQLLQDAYWEVVDDILSHLSVHSSTVSLTLFILAIRNHQKESRNLSD